MCFFYTESLRRKEVEFFSLFLSSQKDSKPISLTCMFPAFSSAIAGPLRIGHLHTTSGLMTPEFRVMLLPVSLQVDAAQSANSPEQTDRGTGALPATSWRNLVRTYSLSLSAVELTS